MKLIKLITMVMSFICLVFQADAAQKYLGKNPGPVSRAKMTYPDYETERNAKLKEAKALELEQQRKLFLKNLENKKQKLENEKQKLENEKTEKLQNLIHTCKEHEKFLQDIADEKNDYLQSLENELSQLKFSADEDAAKAKKLQPELVCELHKWEHPPKFGGDFYTEIIKVEYVKVFETKKKDGVKCSCHDNDVILAYAQALDSAEKSYVSYISFKTNSVENAMSEYQCAKEKVNAFRLESDENIKNLEQEYNGKIEKTKQIIKKIEAKLRNMKYE